ncbi:MAG: right-handed parallel beta-helix repeat-containing protein [Spirochaetaceae bacterium]|jgi:hypothetical protein|nr:right-handed parallel beta-helix repeat-containing protein [Spirochaetaceae bacterium]
MEQDLTARLPDGTFFPFWEDKTKYSKTLFVDCNNPNADDKNEGSEQKPFKTIGAAAAIARPCTKVLIKKGVYRETVSPAFGGDDAEHMVMYEAASKDDVVIKASVEIKDFQSSTGWSINRFGPLPKEAINAKVYRIDLNPKDFMGYNPFCAVNIIHDRLFIEYEKTDMTTYLNRRGMVFCDGKPLKQVPLYNMMGKETNTYWVEANGQKVHFRLKNDDDPKNHTIEITNREQCFAPEKEFLSFIHVKGITCAHAAGGAPVPQRGSISAHRGHHWIIEDCTVDWSNGVGIDCGNECWHHSHFEGQVLGYDIIRRCTIKDVGVCGIAAMWSKNLLIEDNLIEGSGWQRMELSWEAAGIKVHNANGALFRRNVIRGSIGCDSIWMDMHNYNCRLTQNVLIDGIDSREHIFMECGRDEETMIDNNIIWNVEGRYDRNSIKEIKGSAPWYRDVAEEIANGYGIYAEGTDRLRIVNNLIGMCNNSGYFAKTVAFRITQGRGGTVRNNKFYNNIFYDCKEAAIKMPNPHNEAEGNCYIKTPFNGGYLRVLYPAPTMCLDLPAWQEFLGFDKTGIEGDLLDISIDSKALTMTIKQKETVPAVRTDDKANTDFAGNATAGTRIPGPIANLKEAGELIISIDPRH